MLQNEVRVPLTKPWHEIRKWYKIIDHEPIFFTVEVPIFFLWIPFSLHLRFPFSLVKENGFPQCNSADCLVTCRQSAILNSVRLKLWWCEDVYLLHPNEGRFKLLKCYSTTTATLHAYFYYKITSSSGQ